MPLLIILQIKENKMDFKDIEIKEEVNYKDSELIETSLSTYEDIKEEVDFEDIKIPIPSVTGLKQEFNEREIDNEEKFGYQAQGIKAEFAQNIIYIKKEIDHDIDIKDKQQCFMENEIEQTTVENVIKGSIVRSNDPVSNNDNYISSKNFRTHDTSANIANSFPSANHHNARTFKCINCNYIASSNAILLRHSRIHTGEKPYRCDFCNYRAAQKSNLKTHLRIHTGEKPHLCTYCDFRTADRSYMKEHIRIHTGDKPYNCDYCPYITFNKSNLQTHIKVHTGEKKFKCDYCNYRAARKTSLQIHVRSHTGEKFQCSVCDFTTTNKSSLNRHISNHRAVKK